MNENYDDESPFLSDEEMEDAARSSKARVDENRARRLAEDKEAENTAANIRKEPDIVKRAKALFTSQQIQFKDVKQVRKGDAFITQPLMTDENKWTVLQTLFEGEDKMPHRDHYRGRIVDHDGNIIDDHYPVVRWVEAFSAGGLKGVTAKGAREAIKEWALSHQRNDLINHVQTKIPEWDGVPRMRRKLVDMFESNPTPLNLDFGQYFWLSIYARVMIPGSLAPIVLSLFGAQGCGKSLFTKRLCQIITGNEESDSVQLNLDGDRLDFLRNITGQSIIAAVGEMSGFTRSDLNKIKDFITRESDQLHYKFEGTFTQQRQWITVMDGNKYEGLQRDESGNRRFYPMFCGQLPDELNKPRWRADFSVKQSVWETFEGEVWQIMAECAEWMEENGEHGYQAFVRSVIAAVAEFSKKEMARDSGTNHDDVFDIYLLPMLKGCEKFMWKTRQGQVGVGVRASEFKRYFTENAKNVRPNWKHLKNKMSAIGGVEFSFSGGYAGFFFPGYETIEDFKESVGVVKDFVADGEMGEQEPAVNAHGGF